MDFEIKTVNIPGSNFETINFTQEINYILDLFNNNREYVSVIMIITILKNL